MINRSERFSSVLKNKNMIFPNLITILGLLCGIYSILLSFMGNFTLAAYVIILAAIFDSLDGKVARLVKGTSEFGVQLDSLCDLVSFGVAPALLAYNWLLMPFGKIGIMAVFLYVAAGALRLARFNVQTGKISSDYFIGLPIPGAAVFITSAVLFVRELNIHFGTDFTIMSIAIFFLVSIYLLAFLMVSSIPFYSFKNISYLKRHPFNALVIIVILIFIIGLYFEIIFFLLISLYISIGVILSLFKIRRKKVEI